MWNKFHRFIHGQNVDDSMNLRFCLVIFLACGLFPALSSAASAYGHDWPMWRYDAGRCASSPEKLPAQLNLLWVRELAPPRPAWPASQDRLQFDASYEPVVAGKTIFVGSMVCDSVTAYDTETGAEKWRFYTDGPVRFAPVAYKDKLYVACDDGCLYCLSARDGTLIRKFPGGPAPNKVIGNDRVISTWPARGGPVLYDGTIYFAAGIWPFMGTFIHAIDAESGRVVWTNSGSGSTYLMQPHSSPAFAGVAPQGYLVATEDKLLISGGRSVPAAYDRKTGQFLYYRLNDYGKAGRCEVMASDEYFFNSEAVYGLSDGMAISKGPASVLADDVVIAKRGDGIAAYRLAPDAKKVEGLWEAKTPSDLGRIHLKAGSRLYCSGEGGAILALDVPANGAQPDVSWRTKVDGRVWGMLAADGKLFVVTLEGGLYCFSGEAAEPKRFARRAEPLPAGFARRSDQAKQILETTERKEGYCLLLGLGMGDLLYRLLDQSQLHVVALDPDAGKVEAMRRKLDDAGLYGTRAAVHVGDITTMQLAPYMADLIVSEDLDAASLRQGNRFLERVFHSLRPYGGTACFAAPQAEQAAILKQADELELPGCKTSSSGGFAIVTRAGALPDSADWTHQYADSANTVMSRDKRVKAPLGLLWFGGPANDKVLPRHGHGPSPQVVDGRLFIEGRNMLRAVDVYTGRLLWEREFQDLGEYYDNTSHQPGANEIGSNYVTVSDGVYLVYEHTILVLDPATGRTTKEFSLPGEGKPHWGTILVWDDLLLATASPLDVPLGDRHGQKRLPENAQPVVDKGAQWQYLAGARPNDAWTGADFNGEDWSTSQAGFGSDDTGANKTVLPMVGRYSVVYIRKSFNVPEPGAIAELGLVINYDDAFIAYLNGEEVLRVGVTSGRGARASGVVKRGTAGSEYFKIDNPANFVRKGTNVLAIEGHNEKVTSSGFILDPYLVVVPDRSAGAQKITRPTFLDNVTGVAANADYASGSKILVVMDRHTGEVLWKRSAEYSFRHNAIVAAAGKIFCIDGMSDAKLAYFKRRGLSIEPERSVYALEAQTGRPLWKANQNVFGTWLGYSEEHDVLLEASSRSGDRALDEADKGMAAYRGTDGKVLWGNDDSYKGPPILYHNWVITQTGGGSGSAAAEAKAFDLLTGRSVMRNHPMTGEALPWEWVRFKGCNTAIASENLLTFRSASGAFADMTAGGGTASIGGFKSGCTSNLIIANGVLNAPDYTRTCVCSYQNQASLALVHSPEVAYWTFDHYPLPEEPKPVKQVGINFGAPGNRYAENGTLWLEFPSVGGPSPDVPVRAEYQDPEWFRHDSSAVQGPYNWITASGVTGLREVRVRMFIQAGGNPSAVDAFDKHIGKIPIWPEEQIKGAFEQARPYTVRLYFAETEPCEVGRRVFDVHLQDKRVLANFDIVKEAGGINRSVVKEFKGIEVRDDLKVSLVRAAGSGAEPLLCGIEITAEGW